MLSRFGHSVEAVSVTVEEKVIVVARAVNQREGETVQLFGNFPEPDGICGKGLFKFLCLFVRVNDLGAGIKLFLSKQRLDFIKNIDLTAFKVGGNAVRRGRTSLFRESNSEELSCLRHIAVIGGIALCTEGDLRRINGRKEVDYMKRTESKADKLDYPLETDPAHIKIDEEKRTERNKQKDYRYPQRCCAVNAVPALDKRTAEDDRRKVYHNYQHTHQQK